MNSDGPWQLRITPEGSAWLWKYNKARGKSGHPTQNLSDKSGKFKHWEQWVDEKLDYDRWNALFTAYHANLHFIPPSRSGNMRKMEYKPPKHPGAAPSDLVAKLGNPPNFAVAVPPMLHKIRFSKKEINLQDTTNFSMSKFAYYRFSQGINSPGSSINKMTPEEIDALFNEAKVSNSEKKVLLAVASLEGGFDTINTYDTGYVSVGFMQFAAMKNGDGSLTRMLANYKKWYPSDYNMYIRRYGIDVLPNMQICTLDPSTGVILSGADAVQKIIDDKRLTAVFKHAGTESKYFKIAQIKSGLEGFYPINRKVTVTLSNGKSTEFRIGDVFKSEAGLATVMDKLLNTGRIDKVVRCINAVIAKHKIKSVNQIKNHEREIIKLSKYRKDFLQDSTLSKPGRSQTVKNKSSKQVKKTTSKKPVEKKDDTVTI